MNAKIRKLEFKHNTYYVASVCKTSYEEQEERRKEFLMVAVQRILAVVLMVLMTFISIYCKDGMAAFISYIIGLPTLLSKKFIFG
jgi:predicted membrane protein